MLRILLLSVLLVPMLGQAEIYKWKDSDGKTRYSDVPPPSNVQQEPLYGKKLPKPASAKGALPPLAPVEGDIGAVINKNKTEAAKAAVGEKVPVDKNKTDKTPLTKEEAAAKRAKDAEQQKKAEEAKQAELKFKQDSCKAARANLAMYNNGGRIAKTNEQGEREYLSDADISQAKADTQKDVEKYCE